MYLGTMRACERRMSRITRMERFETRQSLAEPPQRDCSHQAGPVNLSMAHWRPQTGPPFGMQGSQHLAWLLVVLAGAVLLGLDASLPLSSGNGALYVLLMFAAFFIPSPVAHYVLAGYATLLMVIGYLLSNGVPHVPIWLSVYNRVFALLVVWASAWLVADRQRAALTLQQLHDELEDRVATRTKDLADVNALMRDEIRQRREVEGALRTHETALEESQVALRRGQADLQRLTAQLMTAQEQERRRISRELHDDVNQRLALLAMDLRALEQGSPTNGQGLRTGLRSVMTRTNQLSDDIRRLAYQFHPSILDDLGLAAALQQLAGDFESRTGIRTILVCEDHLEDIPEEAASCLYRVVQEAFANTAKHARTSRVEIELTADGSRLELTVQDHGCGFDPQRLTRRPSGMGLLNMQERVRAVAGTFTLHTAPGQGTCIRVTTPLLRESIG